MLAWPWEAVGALGGGGGWKSGTEGGKGSWQEAEAQRWPQVRGVAHGSGQGGQGPKWQRCGGREGAWRQMRGTAQGRGQAGGSARDSAPQGSVQCAVPQAQLTVLVRGQGLRAAKGPAHKRSRQG